MADEAETPPLPAVGLPPASLALPPCAMSGSPVASQAQNAQQADNTTEVPKSELALILVSIRWGGLEPLKDRLSLTEKALRIHLDHDTKRA